MKPVIGIMPLYDLERQSIWMLPGYVELIEKNGGVPLILPLTENQETLRSAMKLCDGFIFTGGQDIAPELYGEEKKDTCGDVCHERDTMDIFCLEEALRADKPVLGICRGLQLLNVVNGGTLYQDLETEGFAGNPHQMKPPYNRNQHKVTLVKDSPLFDIFKTEKLSVNSYHHQAIKKLGKNLLPAAFSEDQLIEAIYMSEKTFVVAVQWHPEFFAAETPQNKKLMTTFLAHC